MKEGAEAPYTVKLIKSTSLAGTFPGIASCWRGHRLSFSFSYSLFLDSPFFFIFALFVIAVTRGNDMHPSVCIQARFLSPVSISGETCKT